MSDIAAVFRIRNSTELDLYCCWNERVHLAYFIPCDRNPLVGDLGFTLAERRLTSHVRDIRLTTLCSRSDPTTPAIGNKDWVTPTSCH
jgi:hypothetical protein